MAGPEDGVKREVSVTRYEGGSRATVPDVVADDALVAFDMDRLGTFSQEMTPIELDEFVLGHLLGLGEIAHPGDVASVEVSQRGGPLRVRVRYRRAEVPPAETDIPPLGVAAGVLASMPEGLRGETALFEETGAFHYAFLVDRRGRRRVTAFDVSRHVAVDKAIGKALTAGEELSSSLLLVTSRISAGIVRRCLVAGIPLVASRGAPMASAVEAARAGGLGLVGFLRGGRFNVYSGEGHIDWD